MGTTLTGTKPKDTYDSLIKVTDNGPLSATAKYLSDGLGNDSVLALSTGAVGVGTTSPYAEMDIFQSTAGFGGWKYDLNLSATDFPALRFLATTANTGNIIAHQAGSLVFLSNTTNGVAGAERMRVTAVGNVGIGTSAPNTKLDVNGTINVRTNGFEFGRITTNNVSGVDGGLTFQYVTGGVFTNGLLLDSAGVVSLTKGQLKFPATQVASADANTLDDYEEGTWTMGISFGGASVGVTYTANTGTYTKIGRQVTVNGYLALSSKGSSSGQARVTGLPFTNGTGSQFETPTSLRITAITFADYPMANVNTNATTIDLTETTNAGVLSVLSDGDFANNSKIMLSATYFV